MDTRPKGAVHRVVEFVVSCGMCDADLTGANSRAEAVREALAGRWRRNRTLGWVCQRHSKADAAAEIRRRSGS